MQRICAKYGADGGAAHPEQPAGLPGGGRGGATYLRQPMVG